MVRTVSTPLTFLTVLAAIGLGEAAGFLLIHVAPHWGALSDPYFDSGTVNAISWLVLAACMGVSLYAVVIGWGAMRSRAGVTRRAES